MAQLPDPDKVVGDPGHTDDHNNIVLVLIDHQGRIQQAEGILSKVMTKEGMIEADLNNSTSSYLLHVNIPSGDRSAQPDVIGVYKGSSPVFSLDGNGYVRARSVTSDGIVIQVQGHASQTADLQQWIDSDGNILAKIDRLGNFDSTNTTPTTPADIVRASGLIWDSSNGARPQVWSQGDFMELRGTLRKQDNTPFDFTQGPVLIGSLPYGLGGPPSGFRSIQPTQQSEDDYLCQIVISPDGTIHAQARASHRPIWISLDGIRYRRS